MNSEQAASLRRLIALANGSCGGSRIAADFLLAWWNGQDNGGFVLTDLWGLDPDYTADAVRVFAFIGSRQVYPDSLGLGDEFRALWARWRKPKRSRKSAGVRS